MKGSWIKWFSLVILTSCQQSDVTKDGSLFEIGILSENNLVKDFSGDSVLREIMIEINCADSATVGKKMVLSDEFGSKDLKQILVIPFVSNGVSFRSSAYSDVRNRYILINPQYIRQFAKNNTLNDTTSFRPVLELMLLHEIGHFILNKTGSFDVIDDGLNSRLGEKKEDTQPEFMTTDKQTELSADSLAVDMVKKNLYPNGQSCLNSAFDIELIIPGMQFQLSGMRMIDRFGSRDISFLHDPSKDHPNLELRVTFMNYFLNPRDSLRQMIDDYLYNRTVAPVHRQEMDPGIFQGDEKHL